MAPTHHLSSVGGDRGCFFLLVPSHVGGSMYWALRSLKWQDISTVSLAVKYQAMSIYIKYHTFPGTKYLHKKKVLAAFFHLLIYCM